MDKSLPISSWLVLGWFPLDDPIPGRWLENGYCCESSFAPSNGDEFDGRTWTRYKGDLVDFRDESLPFESRDWGYAYAATYVRSEREERVHFLVSSDDGVAVWLNGNKIHSNETRRNVADAQDAVAASLKKGWNILLCKVTQCEHEWKLRVRVARGNGKGVPNLNFSTRNPSSRQFPGLQDRNNGIVLSGGVSSVSIKPCAEGM